jgi:RHS repeat-associated protein
VRWAAPRSGAEQSADYLYNAQGQRAIKTVNGQVTVYHYGQSGQLLAETDAAGALQAEYLYLSGQPLAKIDATGTSYIHPDHLGTPQLMTDGQGTVVWQIQGRPFGDNPTITGTQSLNLRFPGQYYDAETDLHQNWFRDYLPKVGRYVEADPIGLRGGLNLFVYVQNNPINFVDPFGLFDFKYYGNYGGPGWTAGKWRSWEDIRPGTTIPAPINSQDFAYLRHDQCYGICRNSCNEEGHGACFNRCDNNLVQDLLNLDNSSFNSDIHRNLAVPTFVGQQIYRGLSNALPKIYHGLTGAFR